MITHTFSRGWSNSGSISKSTQVQAEAENNIDAGVPAATANELVAFVLDVSQLKGIYMVSDRAVTVKTNSSGSPVNTFTLAANIPFMWVQGDPAIRDTAGVVFTTDVTALYMTNADADNAATVQIRCIYDPTV